MKNKLPIVICLSLALLFSIYYITMPTGTFSSTLFDVSMIVVAIVLIVFLGQSQASIMKGFWWKPSYLFILGYLIVNLQFITDFRLGLKTTYSYYILYPNVLNHCLVLAVIGLCAFVAGYSLLKRQPRSFKHQKYRNKFSKGPFLVFVQILVFIGFLYNINLATFLSGADYGTAEHNYANYFESLLYVCNAVIIVSTISTNSMRNLREYLKSFPRISLIIIVLYILMRLLSGDRGPFIYTILLLVFGYLFTTKKKIRLHYILGLTVISTLFISVVGIARSLTPSESFFSRLMMGYDIYQHDGRFKGESQTIVGFTEELGFSFVVNQVDVNAVVSEGAKLHYGAYQLNTLANSIPFMPSFIANVLKVKPEDRSSSGFANYHFFGEYDRNWGIGTSCLGDFFLDLGFIGVLLGFLCAGMLMKYLDYSMTMGNKLYMSAYLILFVLLFSAKTIYMPRSVLLIDLQGFVLGCILIYLNNILGEK